MKKVLVILLIFLFPASVYAMEVTSPFGWRWHPIREKYIFHSGVDVAGDYGDSIPVVKSGVVSCVDFDPGGYGNMVIVDHPDGTQTLYGHCQQIFVVEGQSVTAGQVIAAVGSTGGSTGPHVHVELRENGSPVDPMAMLLAAGWDLSYDGNGIPITDENLIPDADEMPWEFGDFYDIAEELRKMLEEFSQYCQKGLSLIQGDVMNLLQIIVTIDLALSSILFAFSDPDPQNDWMQFIIRKILKYGFIVFLVGHWQDFINTYVLDSFTQIAIHAGGGGAEIADNSSDPSKIVQKGVLLATPVFNYISTFSGIHLIANLPDVILAMFLAIGIFICFAIIGIQFFLTYLEFYITAFLSIILVPLGVVKQLKSFGEKGVGAVISSGIKLMVFTFIVALIVHTVKDFTTTKYDHLVYFHVFLGSLALMFFTIRTPKIITKLLSGSPKF